MKKIWSVLWGYMDILVLFFCLVLVFGIWYWGVKHDTSSAYRLSEKSHGVNEKMTEYVNHMFDYAKASVGLFEQAEVVTQDGFSVFVKTMMSRSDKHESLQSFAIYKKVNNTVLVEFKKELLKVNKRAGYDMVADEKFGSQFVLVNAVDGNGEKADFDKLDFRLSGEGRSVLEKMNYGKSFVGLMSSDVPGKDLSTKLIHLCLPINKSGELWGFVTLTLSADGVSKEIGLSQDREIFWSWSWNDQAIATSSATILSKKKVYDSFGLDVDAGQTLKFNFAMEKKVAEYWNWVLGLGILMSFIVYGMGYALSLSEAKTRVMAEAMTKDLLKYKLAIDSNNSHVIITDPDGVIVYANDSVSRLTGYAREEIIGSTPRLWGKQMPADFYLNFWDTIKNKRLVFRGEVTNRRKDGIPYVAGAVVSPIISGDNELLGFVGSEMDITDRKKNEDDLKKRASELKKMNDLMVGRELKMMELKKELAEIKKENEK